MGIERHRQVPGLFLRFFEGMRGQGLPTLLSVDERSCKEWRGEIAGFDPTALFDPFVAPDAFGILFADIQAGSRHAGLFKCRENSSTVEARDQFRRF